MTRAALTTRLPWMDRWCKPNAEQLMEPLRFHQKRAFTMLLERLRTLGELDQSIVWYGPSWRWTIHYAMREPLGPRPVNPRNGNGNGNGNGHGNGKTHAARTLRPAKLTGPCPADEPRTLCYVVPNLDRPLVCVPLTAAVIQQLPKRRLARFISEGITSAKCAVSIRWAMWSPSTENEVTLLIDLLRRVHQAGTQQVAA
jgi:hypothetical protein